MEIIFIDIEKYNQKIFEDIKHIDNNGVEYWFSRELQDVLEYKEWRNFFKVIDKAKTSEETSDIKIFDYFVDVNKTIKCLKEQKKYIR